MATLDQKRELLESIGSLNPFQQARLLDYIRKMSPHRDEDAYRKLKTRALAEIRQALRSSLAD